MSSTPERELTPMEEQWQPLRDPLMSQRCKFLDVSDASGLSRTMVVCAADSDITIQSSDGVLFRLHKANLKISSGSWNVEMPDYQLSETSAVLDLLFQFCYPERQPDLDSIDFDNLTKLAEAAEKYKVFSAMNICKIAMR
jgi:hypothetical protein